MSFYSLFFDFFVLYNGRLFILDTHIRAVEEMFLYLCTGKPFFKEFLGIAYILNSTKIDANEYGHEEIITSTQTTFTSYGAFMKFSNNKH